jgi:hypothetical protein
LVNQVLRFALSPRVEQPKKNGANTKQGDGMKKEYDFTGGQRGKFYRADAQLNLPIYLDKDVAEFIQKHARRKKIDRQTVVNSLLRGNKNIIQSFQ